MDYLLFLNKFDLDVVNLKKKISKLDSSAKFFDDIGRLNVSSKLKADDFLSFQEISKIVSIFSGWNDFNFGSIKKDCLSLCKELDVRNYFIELKFHDKIKISGKSLYKHINPYLKHEGITVSEDNGGIIYLELKKFNEKLMYRVSYSPRDYWFKLKPLNVDFKNFVVVIENPTLVSEVSDFLRLCWIFKLPLYIITQNKDFNKTLKKAKEETKGIEYDKMQLDVISHMPEGLVLVGFSKHANKNEKDLKEILLSNKKLALVFGDDKYGLTQEIRDKLDYAFRLTPEIKKPLRASHALSYVLGIYVADKI